MMPEALKQAIEERHGTVYRFCKKAKLPKSVVYKILRGRYSGNTERQTRRIRRALEGHAGDAETAFEAIRGVACARCAVSGPCTRCEGLFREQAAAVIEQLGEA